MNLATSPRKLKFLSRIALTGATFIALVASQASAAELVMFERAGCEWCAAFDREVAPVYGKTDEGLRAPLRRVNIDAALPADLAFIEVERLTPMFVLIDKGREVGRIRGYPGEEHFWGLLGVLIGKMNAGETKREGAKLFEKFMRASG
jgi:thioredoxin-related protein